MFRNLWNSSQKIYIEFFVTPALVVPASTTRIGLYFIFTALGFGAIYSTLGIVPSGGGGGGDAVINSIDPMLPILREILSEVDEIRRNLMHQFRETALSANTINTILNANHAQFAQNHPTLMETYTRIQQELSHFYANAQALSDAHSDAESAAFHNAIDPLDNAASDLQNLINELDPSIEFSDTDDEKIQAAAKKVANRNGKNFPGAGSPSK